MRNANLSPLYRQTVGFDHLFRLLDAMSEGGDGSGYPPYNIERTGENAYQIAIAVAGFSRDDLSIEVKENTLRVAGAKSGNEAETKTYLHRGIGQRAFERRFQLADFIEVKGADLRDGMLVIALERNLPERMKPRTVEISVNQSVDQISADADRVEDRAAA